MEKKTKSDKGKGKVGVGKTSTKSDKNSTIQIKGVSKSVVNFKPTTGESDGATEYIGKSPAALTLEPGSSNKPNTNSPVSEAVLSITARRKKSNQMKRMSGKLTRLRAMKKNQLASGDRLKYRAQKMARNIVRSRFAGQRGKNYSKLSSSDKIAVDTMIKGKSKLIKRIAQRLLPVTRKAEFLRLQGVRTHKRPAKITRAGGLGLMPKIKLVTSETEYNSDLIAENLAICILEGKADKLDQLMRAGLADRDSINLYRKALADPEYAKRYSVLRDKAFSMLDKLIDTITTDQTIFFRTKDNIQKKYDFNKTNDKKRLKESMDISEGRKPNAEKSRIEKAKKDNKTFLSVSSNARSMQARMGDRTGKKPLRDLPYPPEQGDKKAVSAATRTSARKINRQLNPPGPIPPEKRVYRLRTSMSMPMGNQPTNSSVAVIPKKPAQFVATMPMGSVSAAPNVTLVTGKSKLVPKAPTTTKLPAVTAPVPTPAIKTLKPKSKPGLLSKIISKFGRAASNYATRKFDLDDKQARLSNLERESSYKARMALARGRGTSAVALAKGEADSMVAHAKGTAAGNRAKGKGSGRADRIMGAARGHATVDKSKIEAAAMKLKASVAKELRAAKDGHQKEMLMTINKQMVNLLKKHAEGSIDQVEYERAIGRIQSRFRQAKNWPLNLEEKYELPTSLQRLNQHPSHGTLANTKMLLSKIHATKTRHEQTAADKERGRKKELVGHAAKLKTNSEKSKTKLAGTETDKDKHERKMQELKNKAAELRIKQTRKPTK